ncbi:MAG: hypothetical protein IPI19_11755 [Ignavibacteriales bacterium]|nr:hypothetical protein [Ignavibacteriales bacterium]
MFEGIEENADLFNNSYYLPKTDLSTSTCKEAFTFFVLLLENENAYGGQFHPEMSGEAGLKLIKTL